MPIAVSRKVTVFHETPMFMPHKNKDTKVRVQIIYIPKVSRRVIRPTSLTAILGHQTNSP